MLAVAVGRTYRMNQALAPNVGIDRPGGLSDQSLLHVHVCRRNSPGPVFDIQHLDFSPSSLSMTPICRLHLISLVLTRCTFLGNSEKTLLLIC